MLHDVFDMVDRVSLDSNMIDRKEYVK